MNKKEIIQMLRELILTVQDKRDHLEKKIKTVSPLIRLDFIRQFEFTDGQLYELNYILSKITQKEGRTI